VSDSCLRISKLGEQNVAIAACARVPIWLYSSLLSDDTEWRMDKVSLQMGAIDGVVACTHSL
jgi:hypothetical protein